MKKKELPKISYNEREYKIFINYQEYTPPVVEFVWEHAGWGTNFYVLKKGYTDRNDRNYWKLIYKNNCNYQKITEIGADVATDSFGFPIIILEHSCDEKTQRSVNSRYAGLNYVHTAPSEDEDKVYMYVFSDEDDQNFTSENYSPKTFKVMDFAENNEVKMVVYRVNDMAQSAEFSLDGADEEFSIIIPK